MMTTVLGEGDDDDNDDDDDDDDDDGDDGWVGVHGRQHVFAFVPKMLKLYRSWS